LKAASKVGEAQGRPAGETSSPVSRGASSGASGNPPTPRPETSPDLLAALTGRDADRERAVAHRTRRVVLSSHGVLQEQKQDKSRARSVALAVTVVVLILIAPLLWEVTDSLVAGEHLGDPRTQWSLWACIICPMLLGAALIVGWWRNRS